MAKISTYPIVSTPTVNDLLIGTDVENLNETKNFALGDIAALIIGGTYVPYTGANANVDLGLFSIEASSFILPGGLSTQFLKADGSLDSTTYQVAGNYITGLSGEATASGPGVANVTLSNGAVIGKVLTGLTVTGGSISASDSILQAFGKLQNQVNSLYGGAIYQGTWNALTNTPTLTSSVGTQGYYYIVNVAGNTVLDGISDWNVGDWAIFDGTAWQQVDNTDTVVSVNGKVGVVVLTTTDINEGTNLYYTDGRARAAITLTTTGSSGASTYNNISGILNVPNYTLSGLGGVPFTRELTINGTTFDLSANRSWLVGTVTSIGTSGPITGGTITGSGTIGITQSGAAADGYLSSVDWNTFNNKQNALTNPVTGTGTIYYLPMWTGVSALGDSVISQGSNIVNFNFDTPTGSTINYINTNGVDYTYTIQMNNFGTRQTYHSYTDGNIIQRINGNDVSKNLQSGQLVLPYYTSTGSFSGTSAGYLGFDASGNILTVAIPSLAGYVTGSGIAGQVAYWNGTNSQTGSNNLFWDAANGRLGIGTNTPTNQLSVANTIRTGAHIIHVDGCFGCANNMVISHDNAVGIIDVNGFAPSCDLLFRTKGVEKMRLFGVTGNFVLQNGGTFTDGGQRLQVNGTSLFTGYALFGSGNSGTPLATLADFRGGSDTDFIQVARATTSSDRYVRIYANGQIDAFSTKTDAPPFTFGAANNTNTSGVRGLFTLTNTFSPTSGTATYAALQINQTIFQTGGASGATRGLYVNPTINAAADWRSIEWSNIGGWGLFGDGNAPNYLRGSLMIGTSPTSAARLLEIQTSTGGEQILARFRAFSSASNVGIEFVSGTATVAQIIGLTNFSGLYGLAFRSSTTEAARFTNTNNFLIGTTTDGGQRLQVNGTTFLGGQTTIQGTTNNDTTNIFRIQQQNGNGRFLVNASGQVVIAGEAFQSSETLVSIARNSFNPTSGTATHTSLGILTVINQTGGANGITRGLYINPTLTAAFDFRAIETTSGNVLFGSNFFWDNTNSRLGIGTNAPSEVINIKGATDATVSTILFQQQTNSQFTGYLKYTGSNNRIVLGGLYIGTNYEPISITMNDRLVTISNNVTVLGNNIALGSGNITWVAGTGLDFSPFGATSAMRIRQSTGNVLIGGTTDGGQKFQVYGTALISGNTRVGGLIFGPSDGTYLFPMTTVPSNPESAGRNLSFYNYNQSGLTAGAFAFTGEQVNSTSGNNIYLNILKSFTPTSGTASLSILQISTSITQTGGANGITRGLYVNPSLSTPADWRSIEWSNNSGWGLYGDGTSSNYLRGSLSITTTNTTRKLNIEQALGGVAAAIGLYAGGGTLNSVIGIDNEPSKSFQLATTGNLIFYSGSTIGNIATAPTNERMRITSAGRLLLGTASEGIYSLDVVGDTRIKGSNTSGATNNFLVQNSSGTSLFGIANDGTAVFGQAFTNYGGTLSVRPISGGSRTALIGILEFTTGADGNWTGQYLRTDGANRVLKIGVSNTNVTDNNALLVSMGSITANQGFSSKTTGTIEWALFDGVSFGPTSGTAVFNQFAIRGTIFQSGGANGITRGIYINPNIVAAADWRAIESNAGGAYFNTTSVAASAILQADSSTKGFLQPRMTTTQKNAIASPATGLQVYDSTTNVPNYYDGTAWVAMGGGASIYTSNGTLTSDRTVSSGGYSLIFNPQTTYITTLTASTGGSSYSVLGSNTLSFASGFSSSNIGNVYSANGAINLQTFAGSADFAQANLASAMISVNSIDFSAAGATITMTQASGIRAMTGYQSQIQYQGTNSGTITHAAVSQNLGFYRPSAATGTLTITNAYSLLINDLNDYGSGFTFTNRWGIYQDGASDNNYFKGKVIIGSTNTVGASPLNVKNLPTSSAGLATGDVWNNGGVLNII